MARVDEDDEGTGVDSEGECIEDDDIRDSGPWPGSGTAAAAAAELAPWSLDASSELEKARAGSNK